MDEEQQGRCLDVMERLMKRPCAAMFLEPVDKDQDGMSSYYVVIRNPMDLGQVQAKLLMQEYSDCEEWKNDVKTIWQNAERFHGKDSYVTSLAHQLFKTFTKMAKSITNEPPMKEWASSFKDLSDRLRDLVAHVPPAIAKSTATYIHVPEIKPMPSKSIQRLVETVRELTDREDAREMAAIVARYEPDIQFMSKNVQLDADILKPITMAALERYVKQRFEKLGKTFPA